MTKLKCQDYGFECSFIIEGDSEQIIKEFGDHMNQIHGIDYQKEVLMKMLLDRK